MFTYVECIFCFTSSCCCWSCGYRVTNPLMSAEQPTNKCMCRYSVFTSRVNPKPR